MGAPIQTYHISIANQRRKHKRQSLNFLCNPAIGYVKGKIGCMTGILLVIGFLVLVVMTLNCLTHRK